MLIPTETDFGTKTIPQQNIQTSAHTIHGTGIFTYMLNG